MSSYMDGVKAAQNHYRNGYETAAETAAQLAEADEFGSVGAAIAALIREVVRPKL